MKSNSPKEVFNLFAKQYQDKFMDFDLYHDTFNTFCELVNTENASVLEIGCGPGNITKYLLKKRPDFNILGIDIAPKMIKLAKKNNPTATFKLLDVKSIQSLKPKYNAIICGFTLPYLSKTEALQFIKNAANLLLPKGVLYISTMEDCYEKSKFISRSDDKNIQLFTYYHQEEYLVLALQQEKFNLELITRKHFPEKRDTSRDLIIIARKL